ncbi:unnamed protein product, partial [Prorocentrum cordatum]
SSRADDQLREQLELCQHAGSHCGQLGQPRASHEQPRRRRAPRRGQRGGRAARGRSAGARRPAAAAGGGREASGHVLLRGRARGRRVAEVRRRG